MTAHKIEVVEVGPSGHTTIEVECRDRAHRDEMMARIRGALDGQGALTAARSHVCRQQHAGHHEQDRWDAMAWMQRYDSRGRCTCGVCERAWTRGDPSARVTTVDG